MSDFDGRRLVAGTIRGLRSFRVTSEGVLTGVTQVDCEFKPGLNHAICLGRNWLFPGWARKWLEAATAPDHQIAGLGCGCGFYAYFDGKNDYHIHTLIDEALSPGHVAGLSAIIEGTGVVTAGDRGFRAQKARLVALVEHHIPQAKAPRWARRFGILNAALAVLNLAFAGRAVYIGAPWWHVALSGLAACIAAACARHDLRVWRRYQRRIGSARRVLDLVRANYPGVPWYPTEAAALATHPLTPPPPAEVEKVEPNREAAS